MNEFAVSDYLFAFDGSMSYLSVFPSQEGQPAGEVSSHLFDLSQGPFLKYTLDTETNQGTLTIDDVAPEGENLLTYQYFFFADSNFLSLILDFSDQTAPVLKTGGVGTVDIINVDPTGTIYNECPLYRFANAPQGGNYQVNAIRIYPATLNSLEISYSGEVASGKVNRAETLSGNDIGTQLQILELYYTALSNGQAGSATKTVTHSPGDTLQPPSAEDAS